MVFSSIPFLFFFLPLFLIIYYLVPFKKHGRLIKNFILLIFSLIFYAWGEPIYILLMVFSSVVDYYNGKMIYKYQNDRVKKNFFLVLSIIINLSLLGFFKYSDFLIVNLNSIFDLSLSTLNLGLPIGISFYTFQTMSYSIDVYRGNVKPEKDFFTFMTYVSMFPQLIAGPIVRYETVSEELHKRTINYTNFNKGIIRFMQGLFKKVLIANNIGLLFTTISKMPINEISVLTSWLGIIAFGLQIYFDFSGYSDMAIGMGKMLGFNYLENFNYPYIAKSITEFWRRWHISLSTWFKDYVYIPLGGNRGNKLFQIRNILIVWSLTGIWHGAAWNFILWGLYFGILLVLEKYFLKKYIDKWPNYIKHIYTIFLIIISWWIFAFDNSNTLIEYGKVMFGLSGNSLINSNFIYYFSNYFVILVSSIALAMPIYPYLNNRLNKIRNKNKQKILFVLITGIYLLLLVVTTSYLVSDTYNPFLYFRF